MIFYTNNFPSLVSLKLRQPKMLKTMLLLHKNNLRHSPRSKFNHRQNLFLPHLLIQR